MATQPAKKFRLGLIVATIWDNDGFYSVSLSRSYKDKSDDWQNTQSFKHDDLLNVARCAERAEAWIGRQVNER